MTFHITNCRLCKSNNLKIIISLGEQMITSRFPIYGDYSTPKTPINICLCSDCSLVQLYEIMKSSELYEHEYGYRSGISNTMKTHLYDYYQEIISKINLNENDVIVDIGSNDSTMLQYYTNKYIRIGVDPTGKQFKDFYGEVNLIPNYFTKDNFRNIYPYLKPKIISSISMFYDLPEPVQFAKDIYEILDDNGIWTCEQSYILSMIKTNSIDTICHEHLEYYGLKQIVEIANQSNFKIIDIKFNDCNGGSFRIYFAKKTSLLFNECSELLNQLLEEENKYELDKEYTFTKFIENCNIEINKLNKFIDIINKNNKLVYIYGASTKGNCLLQYANIGEDKIKYAVERNLNKVGKMTCTGIKIISEEEMRQNPPDYLLVLPWHFKNEIIKREDEFLENGGQFIFPFPNFEIIGKKKKILISGIDGYIAGYLKNILNDYLLYGIGHKNEIYEKNIVKNYFDMNNYDKLKENILIIKPDIIIHLAGISSSHYCLNNPIKALNNNGMITANICDIIHSNNLNIKLFNASSSEIYKGHEVYNIKENDTYMYHSHPYSIAKTMGHNIVKFYRERYNLPFSNGIIFTTESKLKNPEFLLNKVGNHIKNWNNNIKQILKLGNLNSYRNIIHPYDVSTSILSIINQNNGDDYIICNNENHKIEDIIKLMYSKYNIILDFKDDYYYDINTNEKLIYIDNNNNRDSNIININSCPNKLYNIGWKLKYNIDDIICDILEI